jgi:16S rRNA processing protein RimM
VRLERAGRSREFEVERVERAGPARESGVRVRLSLAGISDREAAAAWAGATLSIPESALRPLPEGEYYWRELLGVRCRDLAGADLGRVEEIWPTPAHDVLVLRDGPTTRLLAVRAGTLVALDRARGLLTVDWPGDPGKAS